MKIRRGFTRKINLSNYSTKFPYESAEFSAEYEDDELTSEELQKLAQSDVEEEIARFIMEKVNAIPRKSDKYDKRQKSENAFVEDLEDVHTDFGDN